MVKKILVQRWQLVGERTSPEWHAVGEATTWGGAARIAHREGGTAAFGGLRHPDGGPQYGVIRAMHGGSVYRWDGLVGEFISPDTDDAIAMSMAKEATTK